jgi:imidazolonepropionase-like amidohydrolase
MKISFFLTTIFSVLINISCSNSNESNLKVSSQAILIHNANIINVNDGCILENRAILIDSSNIQSIGDYSTLKSSVSPKNQIDAKNKFVIPGLWDMHVHIEGKALVEDNKALFPVYIAYGITTVRDMASDLGEQVLSWRDEIDQNKFLGPQIFTAGRKLEGIDSKWQGDLEIANEQELEQMLKKLVAYDVDFIKITENTLAGPLFLKSVEESKKRGFKVSGHVPYDITIDELVDAGFSSIEHASHLVRLGSNEKRTAALVASKGITKGQANEYYWSNFNQDTAIQAYQDLGKSNLAITPTLIGGQQMANWDEADHAQDEFLQYLTKRFTVNYQGRIEGMNKNTAEQLQKRKDRYEMLAQQLPYLQDAGITILAGSDAAFLNTFVYPGLALHQELVLYQKAGLSPLQILQSATINGAKFMGKLNSMSTIEVGKQADIVILNSNPLLDIKSTQDIYAVINDGQYFNRMDLDSLLDQAKQKKVQLDNQRE